jgi:tRNA U34 5-methylaminomethyl-2-thiouridine-forming methyltransferase MnmC
LKTEVIITADGSSSLYIKELDEGYHSVHGAIRESTHVFINAGLKKVCSPVGETTCEINILEIGLGTGLNVLLTLLDAKNSNKKINYTAIEPYPITADVIEHLNYVQLLSDEKLQIIFEKIHKCDWNRPQHFLDNFTFCKLKNTVQQCELGAQYDLIYFDAFAPRVQPEMWTEEVFSKIYSATKPNGVLVTYCAKGEVKRVLKRSGFEVESLQGPPGKREMIRAIKKLV